MSNNLSNKKIDTSLLELVHADLNQGAGWQEAVHRCNFVIHIASPYPTVDPKDENELIIPARDGTLRVLHAAQAADVHRVIFLSTIGTIYDGHQGENRRFDETDWSDLSKILSTNHKR